jgi:CRP/FNR family cyclic AMP-dependent transcriptional regulator
MRDADRARVEFLASHPFFRGLDTRSLQEVSASLQPVRFERGALILLEGESGSGVYFVRSGYAKVFRTSEEGRVQTLSMLGPGQQFNEVPALDSGPNPASVEAMTDIEGYFLSRADFLRIVERYPQVSLAILQSLAGRLRQLVDLASDLSLRTVPQRLAKLLLEQAQVAGRLTQHEMAARLGTVREVVGRALKTLTDEGVIRVDGNRVVILDRESLERRAGITNE